MASQFKFFQIPVVQNDEIEETLNKFLRSHRVLHIRSEFVSCEERSFWSLQVEYLTGLPKSNDLENKRSKKAKVDYKEVLSPEDFTLFANLREWRKAVAEKEAVPVYAVFNNEQLAKIAENRVSTKEEMKKINGIGDARIPRKSFHPVLTLAPRNECCHLKVGLEKPTSFLTCPKSTGRFAATALRAA